MLQLAFIPKSVFRGGKFEETLDVFVLCKGLSDVINLKAFVLSASIWNEQGSWDREEARRDVQEVSVWTLPDSVELSLNKRFGPFPNSPAKNHFPTMLSNVVLNGREAITVRVALQRSVCDVEGDATIIPDYPTRKREDVRLDDFTEP